MTIINWKPEFVEGVGVKETETQTDLPNLDERQTGIHDKSGCRLLLMANL